MVCVDWEFLFWPMCLIRISNSIWTVNAINSLQLNLYKFKLSVCSIKKMTFSWHYIWKHIIGILKANSLFSLCNDRCRTKPIVSACNPILSNLYLLNPNLSMTIWSNSTLSNDLKCRFTYIIEKSVLSNDLTYRIRLGKVSFFIHQTYCACNNGSWK